MLRHDIRIEPNSWSFNRANFRHTQRCIQGSHNSKTYFRIKFTFKSCISIDWMTTDCMVPRNDWFCFFRITVLFLVREPQTSNLKFKLFTCFNKDAADWIESQIYCLRITRKIKFLRDFLFFFFHYSLFFFVFFHLVFCLTDIHVNMSHPHPSFCMTALWMRSWCFWFSVNNYNHCFSIWFRSKLCSRFYQID